MIQCISPLTFDQIKKSTSYFIIDYSLKDAEEIVSEVVGLKKQKIGLLVPAKFKYDNKNFPSTNTAIQRELYEQFFFQLPVRMTKRKAIQYKIRE